MIGEAAPPPALPPPSWVTRLLRTPLLTKLVFLDLIINVAAFVAMQRTPPEHAEEVTILSLVLVLVLNAALVSWALRPLQVLEDTTRRVTAGEFSARTAMPRLADRNLVRIGDTLDALLDRVAAERQRVRTLAAQVVAAGDQERARISRELHDGTAQSLSALDMILASIIEEESDPGRAERLGVLREIAGEALAEVRALSRDMHPRVLDDLGLSAALEQLTRRAREQAGVAIHLQDRVDVPIPRALSSVLYRVAQEAVHNAVKHGSPAAIRVEIERLGDRIVLVVEDDGQGFDRAEVERVRRGMGLFVMEERASLVDGTLRIRSAPGKGARVRASLPLPDEAT